MNKILEIVSVVWTFFYVDEATALSAGMTHHGKIWGIPVWVNPSGNDFDACPKYPACAPYLWVCESIVGLALYFIPEDWIFETPMSLGKKI